MNDLDRRTFGNHALGAGAKAVRRAESPIVLPGDRGGGGACDFGDPI